MSEQVRRPLEVVYSELGQIYYRLQVVRAYAADRRLISLEQDLGMLVDELLRVRSSCYRFPKQTHVRIDADSELLMD